MTKTVEEIAAHIGATVVGDGSLVITDVASLESARHETLAFVESKDRAERALTSAAGCLIVPTGFTSDLKTLLQVDHPKLAFAEAMRFFHPEHRPTAGVHTSAIVAVGVTLPDDASVGAGAVLEPKVSIGSGTIIGAGVYVGEGCVIGAGCVIHPNVTVYSGTTLGDKIIVHAGTVLGSDGFGYVQKDGMHHKFPQIGRLIIENDVEIGANVVIDRAALDATIIKQGTKIDNLTQIAHNVFIGEHCALSAQVGVAGSARLENHVTLAGQVGVADHVTIMEGAIVGAQGGVPTGKRVQPKQIVWGTPARPLTEFKTQYAALSRLPKWRTDLAKLKDRVVELEAKLDKL